jgi:hypothetical protein
MNRKIPFNNKFTGLDFLKLKEKDSESSYYWKFSLETGSQ